jgi:hypothetical protein
MSPTVLCSHKDIGGYYIDEGKKTDNTLKNGNAVATTEALR